MSDLEAGARRIYAERQPVTDPQARRYVLPPTEGRRIFRQEIVPDLLARPEPQREPVVVALVGQHGAGKSRAASVVAATLARRGGFAELDGDLYRPYHPEGPSRRSRSCVRLAIAALSDHPARRGSWPRCWSAVSL